VVVAVCVLPGCGPSAPTRPVAEPSQAALESPADPPPTRPVAEPSQAALDASKSPADPPPNAASCVVRVDEVLSSKSFRGYPSTPAMQRRVENMSRQHYEWWIAESHGASYLRCSYRVTVLGRAWRFDVTHDTSFEDPPPNACQTAQREVEEQVREATAQCTDLHRGAFYGDDLLPLP